MRSLLFFFVDFFLLLLQLPNMLAAVLDEGKVWSFQNLFLMLERPLPGNSYTLIG